MNPSRQRQPASRQNQHVGKRTEEKFDNLIDEDEQDRMIHEIHQQYIQQSARIENIFQIICCIVVPLLSLFVALKIQYDSRNIVEGSSWFATVHKSSTRHDKNIHTLQILRWTHVTCNILIHYWIPEIVQQRRYHPNNIPRELMDVLRSNHKTTATNDSFYWRLIYIPYFITLLIAAIAIWITRWQQRQFHNGETIDIFYAHNYYFHYMLCISSAIFIVSAFYLRNDHEQIRASINDLQSSKYRYKAL